MKFDFIYLSKLWCSSKDKEAEYDREFKLIAKYTVDENQ